jgi:hypothetical protein
MGTTPDQVYEMPGDVGKIIRRVRGMAILMKRELGKPQK